MRHQKASVSGDPSHSQLAKDHDTHHFHTLAVLLAQVAVLTVAKALDARWAGDLTSNPAAVAESFLVHPDRCNWQDKYVRSWAAANPAKVARGAFPTDVEAVYEPYEKDVERLGKQAADLIKYAKDNFPTLHGYENKVKK